MRSINGLTNGFPALSPDARRSTYALSRLLYSVTPRPMHAAVVEMFGRSWELFCPVCDRRVSAFAPLSDAFSRALAEHGSDLRLRDFETCNVEAYQCPHCGASDRDRLYAQYLASRLSNFTMSSEARDARTGRSATSPTEASFSLLDIAPSTPLSRHIQRTYCIRYRTADLFMKRVDDRVDVTDMKCYANESFDAFICSHVLEHVADDRKAISELWRILKPGGWGIAMAPINLALEEIRENSECASESDRWKYFGQGDHVRVYSRIGFVRRLQEPGFAVQQLGRDHFAASQMRRCGLSLSSVLYIAEKLQTDSKI